MDLELMAEVQGEKIWWRWANHSMEPWARLWHIKYDQDRPNKQLIRFNEELNGSPIRLKALSGRHIVQDYRFWEIRGGTANLWEESWSQFPKLGMDPRW